MSSAAPFLTKLSQLRRLHDVIFLTCRPLVFIISPQNDSKAVTTSTVNDPEKKTSTLNTLVEMEDKHQRFGSIGKWQ